MAKDTTTTDKAANDKALKEKEAQVARDAEAKRKADEAERAKADKEAKKAAAAKEREEAKAKSAAEREAKKAASLAAKADEVKQREAAKAAKAQEREAAKAARAAAREERKNQPRAPKPWEDLAAGTQQQAPREGSTGDTVLKFMKMNKGATEEELQTELTAKHSEKHSIRKLLRWLNVERGYGFTKVKSSGKINAIAPNLKVIPPKAEKPAPAAKSAN